MKLTQILCCLAIIGTAGMCSGYRILGIYALPIKSHFNVINPLLNGLAEKGHQVDLVTTLPQKEKSHPNYTQIITLNPGAKDFESTLNIETARAMGWNFTYLNEFGYKICKSIGTPEFLELARNPPKDPPYDALIIQLLNFNCFAIIGHLWNIPTIFVSTTSLYPWMHAMIGNPENTAFLHNNFLPIPDGNGFWARFYNTHIFTMLKYGVSWSRQNELLHKYFGPNVPSIQEIERNAALVLMNTYFPINGVKPMTTNLIEIGGLHIGSESSEIDENLKKWLDESQDGVILLTFGSTMRIENLPKEFVEIIFNTLERVAPTRVVMRISQPEKLPIKIPNNIYYSPWIPQEKVLKHPNVKLFITHGGLLGTQESIYYGKPMLCIPFMVDQWTNSKNYVDKKIALSLDALTLKQEEFDHAVNEMLTNPIYRENTERISKLFKDRPEKPIDTANFWIEFVIRNGKDSMRSSAVDLTWWQLMLLDVYLVTVFGILMVIYIITLVVKGLLRFFRVTVNEMISTGKKNS